MAAHNRMLELPLLWKDNNHWDLKIYKKPTKTDASNQAQRAEQQQMTSTHHLLPQSSQFDVSH
jgi:hypothetical protein